MLITQSKFSNRGKFQQLTVNDQQYSLTVHKIFKPRKFLLRRNDYVVSNQSLYQVQSDITMPTLTPGFSYKKLNQQKVSVVKFEQPGTSLFFPSALPELIRIGDIAHFTDIFEPVGADVEQAGVLLSMHAVQLLQAA
uniref:Uncharacterized protein n=1 Tax=Spironucleus salmonicida TaxID=348837 RepID=V6LD09_9EUKA|eukprot:EST42375.1 Hypothetical protein SS50377_18061 [Spironucleus salmonicida]